MIKLKKEDFESQQIFIKSIHSNGMLRYYKNISSYRNGEKPLLAYINKNIFKELIKDRFYKVSSFNYKIPRIAYVQKLKGTVIDVNIFKIKRDEFVNGKLTVVPKEEIEKQVEEFKGDCESKFEKLMEGIKDAFGGNTEVYTDGNYIFDLKNSRINGYTDGHDDGKFIGLEKNKSLFLGSFVSISFGNPDKKVKRYVMKFMTEDRDGDIINVYLPSFGNKNELEENSLDEIEKKNFINLRFMTSFIKSSSKHFDYEDMEILNLEETILDLGVLSLNQIDDYFYDYHVYSKSYLSIVAWLARLTYKADNLSQISAIRNALHPLFSNVRDKKEVFSGNLKFTTSYKQLANVKQKNDMPEKLDIAPYLSNNGENKEKFNLLGKIQQEIIKESILEQEESANKLKETEQDYSEFY